MLTTLLHDMYMTRDGAGAPLGARHLGQCEHLKLSLAPTCMLRFWKMHGRQLILALRHMGVGLESGSMLAAITRGVVSKHVSAIASPNFSNSPVPSFRVVQSSVLAGVAAPSYDHGILVLVAVMSLARLGVRTQR